MSKESETDVEKLVVYSNATEDTQRHVVLICFVSTINKKNLRIHLKKVQKGLKCKEQMHKLFISDNKIAYIL